MGSLSLLQRIFPIAQLVKNPPARLLSRRQQIIILGENVEIIILGENVEKRKHSRTVVGNVNWCSCYGTIWKFLKKLKIELLYDPAIPLPGTYPKQTKKH